MRAGLALGLITLGLLVSTPPAAAQWRGAPLIDGLGGPLGLGEPHSDVDPLDIRPAFPAGLRLYERVMSPFYINWHGSLSGRSAYYSYWPFPFPQPAELYPVPAPPRIAPFEHGGYLGSFDRFDGPIPVFVALRPPADDTPGQLIATWYDIPDRPLDAQQILYNTWQAILTDAGSPGDYDVEFRYHRCEWLMERFREDAYPIIGFDAGLGIDGPGWTWPGSLSPDTLLLCHLSNIGERGIYRYPVRNGTPTGCGIDALPPPGPGRCTDGNHLPGDGCSPDCHLEPDADADARFEAPYPGALDPLGAYDDCADPDEPLCNDDIDGDGFSSLTDNCPTTHNPDQLDYDQDNIGDACDEDADNDGLHSPTLPDDPNSFPDNCPFLYNRGARQLEGDRFRWTRQEDTDRDGIGDACDPDDDGDDIDDCGLDGICNLLDNSYNDDRDLAIDEATECQDSDRCERGDRDAHDSDGDGRVDEADERPLARVIWPGPDPGEDNCRRIPNPAQEDTDGDAIGDACDPDIDGDDIPNCESGLCGPAADRRDNDHDGRIDERDECALGCDPLADLSDQDLDGFVDEDFEAPVEGWPPLPRDVCPTIFDPDQQDSNGDGIGDRCADDDGDGLIGARDNCIAVSNPEQTDLDADGIGDACDEDDDGDGIGDPDDLCPRVVNPEQRDNDGDGIGDPCDPDDDDDGIPDIADRCPLVFDPDQQDTDRDGIGDACDEDDDGDGTPDADDACPTSSDDQSDLDDDGIGDACDDDDDGDDIPDIVDRCPRTPDPGPPDSQQPDRDGDGIGDACDATDDRPFAARTPAEQCAILIERRATTAERIGICPAPRRSVGCHAAPGERAPMGSGSGSWAWVGVLGLLGWLGVRRKPARR